jgi:hypothetical protein
MSNERARGLGYHIFESRILNKKGTNNQRKKEKKTTCLT